MSQKDKIITDHDKVYDYKLSGGKIYTRKKSGGNWKDITNNKGVKKIFSKYLDKVVEKTKEKTKEDDAQKISKEQEPRASTVSNEYAENMSFSRNFNMIGSNTRWLIDDLLGLSDLKTEKNITEAEHKALTEIIRKNLKKGKNYIDYDDFAPFRSGTTTETSIFDKLYENTVYGDMSTTGGQMSIYVDPLKKDTFALDRYNFNDGDQDPNKRFIDKVKGVFTNPSSAGTNGGAYGVVRTLAKNMGSPEGRGPGVVIGINESNLTDDERLLLLEEKGYPLKRDPNSKKEQDDYKRLMELKKLKEAKKNLDTSKVKDKKYKEVSQDNLRINIPQFISQKEPEQTNISAQKRSQTDFNQMRPLILDKPVQRDNIRMFKNGGEMKKYNIGGSLAPQLMNMGLGIVKSGAINAFNDLFTTEIPQYSNITPQYKEGGLINGDPTKPTREEYEAAKKKFNSMPLAEREKFFMKNYNSDLRKIIDSGDKLYNTIQNLPEAVVKANKKTNSPKEKFPGGITQKDIWNGIGSVLDFPQKAMMNTITLGKYDKPSEILNSFGVENKTAHFLADTFADPLNVVGGPIKLGGKMAAKTLGNYLRKGATVANGTDAFMDTTDYAVDKYKNGGLMDYSKNINGKSHNQGGVPMNTDGVVTKNNQELEAEGGEKIINLPGMKKYILPKGEEYTKSNKLDKKYSSAASDKLEKQALLMSNEKLAKINDIKKALREKIQMQMQGQMPMANNGMGLYPNSPDLTGVNTSFNNVPNFTNTDPFGLNFLTSTVPPANPQANTVSPTVPTLSINPTPTTAPSLKATTVSDTAAKEPLGNQFSYGDMSDIFKYGTAAYDLTKAFTPADKENPRLPNYGQSDKLMDSLSTDNTQARQDLTANINSAVRGLRNNTRSTSGLNTQLANIYSNAFDSMNRLDSMQQDKMNQIKGQRAQYEVSKENRISDLLRQNDEKNQMNEAAKGRFEERASDTLSKLGSDFGDKQYAKDLLENRREIAQMSTQEGFKYLNMIATDMGLEGSEEVLEYQRNPTPENAEKVMQFLRINYKG